MQMRSYAIRPLGILALVAFATGCGTSVGPEPTATLSSEPAKVTPSSDTSMAAESEVDVCSPDEPLPTVTDPPGVHPPAALLGSRGAGWATAELGSFEWREGDTISESVGVPAIVPPTVTYTSAPRADPLYLALSERVVIRSWELIYFPWESYEQDPPAGAGSTRWQGEATDAYALCIPAGEAGEFSLTAELDFGDGNHATYRWHVVIPAD